MPSFNYTKAKQSGYSDQEISKYLRQQKSAGVDLYIEKKEFEQVNQQTKQPRQGFLSKAKDFATGVGTGLVSRARDTSQLLSKVPTGGSNPLTAPFRTAVKAVQQIDPALSKLESKLGAEEGESTQKPDTTFGKAGFYSERVGEFLIPGGAGAKASKATLEAKASRSILGRIADKVAPKVNKKEIQSALEEGRLITRSPLSKKIGLKDKIKASDKLLRSAETVKSLIPKAQKLNRQSLFTASKNEVTKIAQKLKPQLKKIKLKEQVKEDIVTSWQDVKKLQIKTPSILDDAKIIKTQKQFEETVLKVIDSNSTDDLWSAVKNYDKKISSAIKNATTENQTALQDLWLDNRRILRDAMDAMAKEIKNSVVSKSFQEMSDLYSVQTNLLNNAEFFKGSSAFKKALLGSALTGAGGAVGFNLFFD